MLLRRHAVGSPSRGPADRRGLGPAAVLEEDDMMTFGHEPMPRLWKVLVVSTVIAWMILAVEMVALTGSVF